MQMAFEATVEVLTSREFKVSGATGPCQSLGKKGANVSDLEMGRGGTNAWSLGGIDPGTTIAIYFDISNPGVSLLFCCHEICCSFRLPCIYLTSCTHIKPFTFIYFSTFTQTSPLPEGKRRLIQFQTKYQHSNGRTRLLATTICGPWHNTPQEGQKAAPPPPGQFNSGMEQPNPVNMNFDQEAATILLAHMAVERSETEDIADVLRWVDRSLHSPRC